MGKYIATPEILWQHFVDFVEFETKNPMYKTEYVGKDGRMVLTPLQVPITFEGFECYLSNNGIIQELCHYEHNVRGAYAEYLPTIRRIKNFCYSQNLKGASVGLFNASIIARKLGMTDKTEVTVKEQPLFGDNINPN